MDIVQKDPSKSDRGHIGVSVQSLYHATKTTRQNPDTQAGMLLSFPATRNVLWDKRPVGASIFLHTNQYKNPALIIEEKTLRLAHRFAQDSSYDTYSCLFIASLTHNAESEGISVKVDRFESGTDFSNGDQTESGIAIPCIVKKNSAKPKTSVDDYGKSIKLICDRCRSKRKVQLEDFISLYAYCSYHENNQNFLFHMDFTMVTSGVKFKMTPVNPVPVVPTALSKNLAGPMSFSHLHREPKSGYLTMDQTRKLLLVLESDPKAPTLPLVGIWISGVSHVRDPFVWACCLRYVFNAALKERIVLPPEAFMVAVYTPIHSKPEFYECVTVNGQVNMQFDLIAGHEVIQLPKDCLGRAQSPLEIELLSVESGEKKDLFDAAIENNKNLISDKNNQQNGETSSFTEDIMPRSIPAPHYGKQASMIRPSVPEVSLLLDENEGNFLPRPVPVPTRMTKAPVYPQQVCSKAKKKSKGQAMHPMHPSSEPASPLVDNYHPGPPQKPSSVPVSPATPQYGPAVAYPASQHQPYQPQPPVSSPYGRYATYPMPPHPAAPSDPSYPHPQHPTAHPVYPYNGFPNMPTPPHQMQMYPPQPNHYQGPSSLPWNVNVFNQNQSPHMFPNPGNVQSCNPPRQTAQGFHGPSVEPNSGRTLQMQNVHNGDNGMNSISPKSVQNKAHNNASPPGQKSRASIAGDSEETLLKQGGGSSPSHRSMPGSVEGSPHHQSGSTDSGLHVSDTPDPDALVNHTLESLSTSASHSQVPADVYELLKMQDMQLKMLKEQLSQLLAKQGHESSEATITSNTAEVSSSVPMPSLESRMSHDMATQSSLNATPVKKPQKCNMAVNTSLWYPEPEQARHDINSTAQGHSFNLTTQDISIQAGNLDCREMTSTDIPVRLKSPQLRLKDRQMYDQDGNLTTDTISLGELQLTSIQDRTEESIMSDMVVDMPAYTSVSPEKHSSSGCTDDESNRSPQLGESVSMYERQNFADVEESEDVSRHSESGPSTNNLLFKNQKQFYQNLMGGVQKFLAKSVDSSNDSDLHDTKLQNQTDEMTASRNVESRQDYVNNSTKSVAHNPASGLHRSYSEPGDMRKMQESSGPQPEVDPVSVEEMTREQLKHLGISMDQPTQDSCHTSSLFLDPAMLPKISYVSLMLDSESDTGVEADALAMKYLTDEQLTELAKLRLNTTVNRNSRNLDGLVSASPMGKSNVTFMGNNHMSFASKKYLERYGLLNDAQNNTDHQNDTLDQTPTKESSFNVRKFLQNLSEKSFTANASIPKMSDTFDQTPLHESALFQQDDSVGYNSDSFNDLRGKPMSTPAEHRVKPAEVDQFADQTPVRLKQTQGGLEPGAIGKQGPGSHRNNYLPASYVPQEDVNQTPGPGLNSNQPPQGWLKGKGQMDFSPTVNPTFPVATTSADNVLDIQRLRELPKLL